MRREELERERGFEPLAACLEGIWLQPVWPPERPAERKPSSYPLVNPAESQAFDRQSWSSTTTTLPHDPNP